MENELVTKSADAEMVVVARNPGEMQVAQAELISWATRKIEDEKSQLAEYKKNFKIAEKSKWRTSGLKRAVAEAEKRVTYYTKIHAALSAGYCIVPNFPIDVFAVRTSRKTVPHGWNETRYGRASATGVDSNSPALGEGQNVSERALMTHWSEDRRDKEGQAPYKINIARADDFKEIDFPFDMAKPVVLDSTSKALALKCFDDLGILPARPNSDPMVIGRIKLPIPSTKYPKKEVSFLVAWFVDTRDL